MCGIAGVIDLAGRHAAPPGTLRRMADAIVHRGPDDDGYLDLPHLGLANRRLSIVGLADGSAGSRTALDGDIHEWFDGQRGDQSQRLGAAGTN